MGKYDAVLKTLLKASAAVTLSQLHPEPIVGRRNVELPQVSVQYADLLAETASGGLWHLELQSTNDPNMPLRMLEYAVRVCRLSGQLPDQAVLYVGREPLRMPKQLRSASLEFRYAMLDIRDLDGGTLLASRNAGDNVLAILTDLRGSEETVRRVLEAIASLSRPQREEALEALLLIAGLRELEETVEREARKMPVFEDILENKVLGREFKRGLEQGEKQGHEKGMEKGLEKGLEEGLAKGLEQGRQSGQVTLLRRQISKRFGHLPPALDQRLSKMSAEEFEEFSLRLLEVQTLDELLS